MNRHFILLLLTFLSIACANRAEKSSTVVFNQELASEIRSRAELDQTAAWIPQGKFADYSKEEWKAYKDSVFTTNRVFLEGVLGEYGYPGFDLVGETGARDYWVMVQHCDFDPAFQAKVLQELEIQVKKGNADGQNFGLLTDRVNLNTGKKQIYGTQVTYVPATGQAIPKPLADSLNVNKRRQSLGFEPIEVYLNRMTKSHFAMNKENMLKRGITEPSLYPTDQ
jgi:hypothetical protein